ncbi:hypothetical protein HNQ77_003244 [Silvibacterium bohemicum]|uniref:TonB-dependent transporter Oar-like beta-barrel domain-containing protein n=1 Tax=Silvibacterium bohemicum TaxID=1577686 RepID=A0A841JVB6_9BACT|nr:TonB-dependent receptor [Silvibacterium bohemicum]MBB6145286.1 hypothetical protein [Silvibacterium bohemicum]
MMQQSESKRSEVRTWSGAAHPSRNAAVSSSTALSKFSLRRVASACAVWVVLILMTGMIAESSGFAQVLYGTLTGNVTDPSGAAIPGATVKALNVATGVEREATSNAEGIYLFNDLIPGTYQVTASASGFAPLQQGGIELLPNTSQRVNVQLKVGSTSQEVTVTTAPPVLQTQTADVNYNLSEQQVTDLPTTSSTGRNFESLYRLVPGSTPPAEQNSAGSNPQRSQAVNVNGISNATNTTRIDGAVDAYPWLPYLVAYLPPTDGISSINVVTGSFNAEQGAAGGSAINVTIKSGTNQFHGSAWEYNSIAQFNAQAWQNRTGVLQKNIYNEIGGAIGGPILKNKLFFFFDYDRVSVDKSVNGIFSVPTADMRAGNFANTGSQIFDPATGTATGIGKTAFAGDMVPANRIAPAAAILLQNLPLPNTGGAGALVNNYFGAGTNAFVRSNYDAKVTYVPTQNTSYFGHYSISPDTISDPQVFGPNPGGGTFDGGQPGTATGRIQNVGLGATHAFSTNFTMDANAGYTRQGLGAQAGDIGLGDYGVNTLKIPGTNNNGQQQYGGIPAFFFTTYASLGNANSGSPFTFRDNQYTGNVNATWVRGTHSVRFGGEYLHAAINHFQPGSGTQTTGRGTFVFSGGATAPSGGSLSDVNSFADFLLGQADNYQKSVQTFDPEALRYSTFAFYGQDTYQVSPKLTLNYGLRYEYYPLPVGDHFGTVRYDPSVLSTVTDSLGTHTVGTVLIGGEGGIPQHAFTSNGWGMIVPRLGLSYSLDDKTVIRAGYGITTDPDTLRNLLQSYPAEVATNINGANSYIPATSLNAGLQSTTTQVGIPALALPNITLGALPLGTNISTATIPKDFRRGYIHSYNLAVQRQFPFQLVANVTYVGTEAVRQQSDVNINAAPPGGGTAGRLLNTTFGPNTNNTDINSLQPFRGSNYNGLQAQLTRTSAKLGSTGLIYTFSKSMDAADNSEANGLVFAYPTFWNRNWALAGYDRKHNLEWWTIYSLPFGKGQMFLSSGPLAYIAGGWKLSTVLSRVSGAPFNVTASSGLLNAPGNTQLADRNYNVKAVLGSNVNGNRQYINPNAFTDVSTATGVTTPRFGDSGRDSVRGPGLFDLDLSLKRTFPIHDAVGFDFVAETFDATNTPQFANPSANIASGGFGVITTSNADRTLRLSGRLTF